MQRPAFEVLYEDNHLLIVNKSAGVLVQGDATGDKPLADHARAYIKTKYAKPGDVFLGVVHRLDRPVSGVVVLARTSKALERMNALFRQKETKKTYLAIVSRKPAAESGNLIHWLTKDEKKNKATAYAAPREGALKSELSYKVVGSARGLYLLEVKPVTGRPHQIRVQLASIGCPIKGDLKYGDVDANEDASICLHASELAFVHPVQKTPVTVKAKPPQDGFWNYFTELQST